ncbi:hypothetical protein QCA50_003908 [Cerrena zonata]|uniref:Uncharacterized protein n=1 Tax=Cerrena zonata TaxID=2478898 RepID=A0AAW0GPX8_9APHY
MRLQSTLITAYSRYHSPIRTELRSSESLVDRSIPEGLRTKRLIGTSAEHPYSHLTSKSFCLNMSVKSEPSLDSYHATSAATLYPAMTRHHRRNDQDRPYYWKRVRDLPIFQGWVLSPRRVQQISSQL